VWIVMSSFRPDAVNDTVIAVLVNRARRQGTIPPDPDSPVEAVLVDVLWHVGTCHACWDGFTCIDGDDLLDAFDDVCPPGGGSPLPGAWPWLSDEPVPEPQPIMWERLGGPDEPGVADDR
jgi:hypothetical protein